MGLYERDYYQDDIERRGLSIGGKSMVNYLIGVNVAVFVAGMFLNSGRAPVDPLTEKLMVSAETLTQPWMLWQLLTAGFAHHGIFHILFNMLSLWMLGRQVEARYGAMEFLRIYLVSVVLGSLAFAAREYFFVSPKDWHSGLGASGAVTTIVMLFVLNNPKQMLLLFMVVPVPAWVVGVLLIGLNLLGFAAPEGTNVQQIAYDVHLAGAAFGATYFYFGWDLGKIVVRGLRRPRKIKSEAQLKLHDPEDYYQNLDSEADRILDKIHREGETSLTARERKILEDYSRRMRQKHR